jgi:hypothetical protein
VSRAWSMGERVEHALRLLDWLAAEAPALDPVHVALRLDEVRDALLPIVVPDAGAVDPELAATDEGGGRSTRDEQEAEAHWVLMALPVHGGHGAPLGCFPTPEVAQAAAGAWSGSPLSWHWLEAARSAGFPWNFARWFAETEVTRPDDLFEHDEIYLLIYPMPAPPADPAW